MELIFTNPDGTRGRDPRTRRTPAAGPHPGQMDTDPTICTSSLT